MSNYGTTEIYKPNGFRITKVINKVDPRYKTKSGSYYGKSCIWTGELLGYYHPTNQVLKQSIEWYPIDEFTANEKFLLRNRAIAGLRSQLDSFRDIAESLAEGKETLSYFAKKVEGAVLLVKTIRKNPAAFAAKRARFIKHKMVTRKEVTKAEYMFYNKVVRKQEGKSWRERAEAIPDGWLEYHFAIAPLIGASDAVREFFASPPLPRIRSYATTKRSRNYKNLWGETFMTESVTIRMSVSMGLTITSYNPNVALLKRVGLTSPLAVAWAVVPFSWVADYFLNTGEMIENLANPYLGLSVQDGYTTVASHTTGTRSFITPEFMVSKRPDRPVLYRGIDYGGSNGTHSTTIRVIDRSTSLDLTYRFVRNPSPINVQRLSYLLSVGYNLMKGK